MAVIMLKNKVVLVYYIQIKFILKFTHLHVFIPDGTYSLDVPRIFNL